MSNVLISGGTGFIGRRVATHLQQKGYHTYILTRDKHAKRTNGIIPIHWNLTTQTIDLPQDIAFETIIHLAGSSIASGCWSKSRKAELVSSRIESGQLLYNYFANHTSLKTFISASAIGIYGNVPSPNTVSEDQKLGTGFIPDLCRKWEKTAANFSQGGIRSVILRIGIVLDTHQGALPTIIKPSKYGLNAILGDGKQLMSWIHIDDLISIIVKSTEDQSFRGIYNAVAPNPVTNELFTRNLSKHLKKRLFPISIPPIILKLMFGEKACLMLEGAGVIPTHLQKQRFTFQYKTIYKAIDNLIKIP